MRVLNSTGASVKGKFRGGFGYGMLKNREFSLGVGFLLIILFYMFENLGWSKFFKIS